MPKKEAYYFSHDSNARNDPKLMRLRVRLKMEGYGVYWCLVELLRDQTDFRLPLDFESIAFGLNIEAGIVEKVVNDFDLFVIEDGFFYSESLIRRMDERKEKSLKASESAKKRWEKKPENKLIIEPDPKETPKINPATRLDFDKIKLDFEKQKGMSLPYFIRLQDLYSMSETQVLKEFDNWKLKNESNAFTIKHAENSFNMWLKNFKDNGTTKTAKPAKQNGANQLRGIHERISGSYKQQ